MKLSQFQFALDADKIAKNPPRWRDECKLMVLHKDSGEIEHKLFKNIIEYFGKGDTFVLNDTKVFPARLYGNKEKTGASIEVNLLRELNREQRLWDVIVDPARKIRMNSIKEGGVIIKRFREWLKQVCGAHHIRNTSECVSFKSDGGI